MRKIQMFLIILLIAVFIPFFSYANENSNANSSYNGWVLNNNNWSYLENGSYMKNELTPDKYYVDSNGIFVSANNNNDINAMSADFNKLNPYGNLKIFENKGFYGSKDDISNLLFLYNKFYNHSNYLHFAFYSTTKEENSDIFEVNSIQIQDSPETVKKAINETIWTEQQINNAVPTLKGKNEEETFMNIVNYICNLVQYDDSLKSYTVCDMYSKGKTVCDGYMKLFYILCTKTGLKAECIESQYTSDILHGYNSVVINGRKRYVDVTFYDALKENIWLDFNPNIDDYHRTILKVYN